jgi:hypothetical protein
MQSRRDRAPAARRVRPPVQQKHRPALRLPSLMKLDLENLSLD